MACTELLNIYCSNLLGESSKLQDSVTKSKSISKKLKDKKKNHSVNSCDQLIKIQQDAPVNEVKLNEKPLITDDGFEIVNNIPPDDSDISDAFESDIEDFEPYTVSKKVSSKVKETEDGFKIISDIPPDDSDVEDAFESDLDEEEWIEEAQSRLGQKANDNSNNNNLKPRLEKLKKPLLDLIQDFDMEDKIYLNENSKLVLKPSEFKKKEFKQRRKMKQREALPDKELQILDYSTKRGKKRRKIDKPTQENAKSEDKKTSKQDVEADMRKARYEIYKFGISSGTQVEKKEAKIDLVVKLGAKPRKNKVVNYKNLMQLRKEQKEKENLKREETREMGLPVKKKSVDEMKKKVGKKKDEIDIIPRVGKFSNGVLKLSEKEIRSINAS